MNLKMASHDIKQITIERAYRTHERGEVGKVKWKKGYGSEQTTGLQKRIEKKGEDIHPLIAEYRALKKTDRGITHDIITHFLVFAFVVP